MRNETKRSAYVVLFLLASLAALAGCDDDEGPAPEFEAVVRAGEGRGDRVALSSLRGRVVVLDFWAHWCEPCRESTPVLNEARAALGDAPVSFFGVNVEETLAPRRVIEEHARFGAAFPSFHDQDKRIAEAYDVRRLPTLVIIDRQGTIRFSGSGMPNAQRLELFVRDLL
jgi:thiol-disulfide isomerase/thioredoxin